MSALILVDLQKDFMPGGALAVKEGNQVLPVVNALLDLPFDLVVATKDWHPPQHGSFASTHSKQVGEIIQLEGISQILWPDHCVQGTPGADFHPGWNSKHVKEVFHKGTAKNIDSYSTFFDNGKKRSTGLADYLKEHHIKRLFLAGLATDYCVKYSALDALHLGFETWIVVDGCRGVNLKASDSKEALEEMQRAGIHLIELKDVSAKLRGGGV